MNKYSISNRRGLRATISAVFLMAMASASTAQDNALSADELEKLVAEQKAALEQVIANRSETQEMAEKLRGELADSKERKAMVQKNLEDLCKQQDELQTDSYKDCMKSSDG